MFLVLHSAEAQCSASVVWWRRNGSTTISTNQKTVLLAHSQQGPCQNVSLKVCFFNTNLYSSVLRSQQTPFWNWSGKKYIITLFNLTLTDVYKLIIKNTTVLKNIIEQNDKSSRSWINEFIAMCDQCNDSDWQMWVTTFRINRNKICVIV